MFESSIYFILSLLTFWASSIDADVSTCGGVQVKNFCYTISVSEDGFSDAELFCFKNKGRLAIPETDEQINAITSLLIQKGTETAFVGYSDRSQRGTLRSDDKTQLLNLSRIVEDTVVPPNTEACISQQSDGLWKRSPCNIPDFFLCQSSDNVTPSIPVRVWSQWASLTRPTNGDQILTIDNIRKTYPSFCQYPDDVQCRVKNENTPSKDTGDNFQMPCNKNGLICLNSDQTSSPLCKYYEVRVLCPPDINECATKELNNCDENADCFNTHGSFRCVCKAGFSGNGQSCFKSNQCVAWGDPHYVSFDQVTHHFMGVCSYRLAETCFSKNSGTTNLKPFYITTANEYRGSNTRVSFAKSVTLNYQGSKIELSDDKGLSIDGVVLNPPQTRIIKGDTIDVSFTTKGLKIQTSFGVEISYDGVARIVVSVPSDYSGQMCGMCGNMNDDASDEWTRSDGSRTNNREAWGNSWMSTDQKDTLCVNVNTTLPNDLCDSTTDTMVKDKCSVLTSQDGPFADCQNRVDPQKIYPSCYFDMCSDPQNKNLLCNAYKMYADECAASGILLDWRISTGCSVKCGPNEHYEHLTSGCQSSCDDPNAQDNCHLPDTSGCVCNDGFLRSGTSCVPKEQCGCYDKDRNYKKIGDVWFTDKCTVKNKCSGTGDVVQDNHVQCHQFGECFQRPDNGEFECRCNPGFEGRPDNCSDIDECTKKSHACNDAADCTNLLGKYSCSCKRGFTGDGLTCSNKDECLSGEDNCSPYAKCFDTYGSFKCVCQNGYEGDGVSCSEPPIDIPDAAAEGCSFHQDASCHEFAECSDLPNNKFLCSCIEGASGDGMKGANNTGCAFVPCPTNSYQYRGYCYTLVGTSQNQSASEAICVNQGAHLATFVNPMTLSFITEKLDIFSKNVPYYIGYSSLSYENVIMPVDFSLVSFENWAKTHPKSGLKCVILLPNNAPEPYKYKSVSCDESYQAICKFPASPMKCPDGWREIQTKCVLINRKPIDSISAMLECARFGGDLASIKSEDEASIVFKRLTRSVEGTIWYGYNKNLYQRSSRAQWSNDDDVRYVKGTANSTASIIPSMPDLECYQVLPNLKWISALCKDNANGYLCEKPQNTFRRCPLLSEYFNGKCYKPTVSGSNPVAQKSCTDSGGQLVSITTYGEQCFIESYLVLRKTYANHWIGLVESATISSIFTWTDGSIFEYKNWNTKEPSLAALGGCVIVTATNNTKLPWTESVCSLNYPGLCEYLNTPCKGDKDCNVNGRCHMGQCRCNPGFQGDGLNSCNNINECLLPTNLCSVNEECIDTVGSWNCTCITDYVRYYNGTCQHKLFCLGDADCAKNGKCYQNRCSCNLGYEGDGKISCSDINECLNFNTTKCAVNATCTNTPGDYSCLCKPGFHGTGKECHPAEKNCHDYLTNHPGSLSGVYLIDTDGLGPLDPVNIYCDMRPNLGITVICNDNTTPKKIQGTAPFKENRTITYEVPLKQMKAVISSSDFCYQDMQFQCQGYMNLLGNTHYVDGNGKEHAKWGSSTTETKCGCGELKMCKNIETPCFCDGSYTDSSYDSGRLIDKSILPITRILTGGSTQNSAGFIQLGCMKCGPWPFDLPKDCHDAKKNFGLVRNDVTFIDVDGAGPLKPFKVMCDVTTKPFGITIVPHNKIPGNYPSTSTDTLPGPLKTPDLLNQPTSSNIQNTTPNTILSALSTSKNQATTLPSSNGPNKVCLSYPADDEPLAQLIANSGGCTQEVKYVCSKGAQLLEGQAYLETFNGSKINKFGSGSDGKCACGVLGKCTNSGASCNCDGNNEGSDSGHLRKTEDLPVKCIVDNNSPSTPSSMSVGPLMCGPCQFGLEPSCHEWVKRGYSTDGAYLVDPDGCNINNQKSNIPEFLVYCKMSTNPPLGITIIPGQVAPKMCVGQEDNLCKIGVTYPLTPEQIKPIIDRSAYCTQKISYTCNIMTLLTPYKGQRDPYSYWRTYGKETKAINYSYFSGNGTNNAVCDCGLNNKCTRCFCDVSDSLTKIDDGALTNKAHLPVGAVWLGYDPSVPKLISKLELGDLECVETFPTCDAYIAGYKVTTEKKTIYYTVHSLDPDGPFGDGPIYAQCQSGVTIIPSTTLPIKIDDKDPTNIGPKIKCVNITYSKNPSLKQLKALAQKSKSCKQYMKMSCVATPLTDYVVWYDSDDTPRRGWAGNADGEKCACGEVNACEGGTNYSCNCDSLSAALTYDHGLLVNKDSLPVTKICFGITKQAPPPKVQRKIVIEVGPLMCTTCDKDIQPDCQRLRENQYQDQYRNVNPKSEAWIVDPDGCGPGKPFTAYCDMKTDIPVGVTVIKPILKDALCSADFLTQATQRINIGYMAANQENILNLKSVSSHCEQEITYTCKNAPLVSGGKYGAYDINGEYLDYFAGPNDDGYCKNNTCKCKANDGIQRIDSGFFTDTSRLPLTSINLPGVQGQRKLCIGELRCYNIPKTCDDYNKQGRLSSSKGNRNNIWAVDPDQEGAEDYCPVLCKTLGTNIVTEILQDPKPLITNSSSKPTSPIKIPYTGCNINQIHNVVKESNFCSQRMDYYCTNTGSLNNGNIMITDYSNKALKVWPGADAYNVTGVCGCSVLGMCPATKNCRCDAMSNDRQYEGGLVTNPDILPLNQLSLRGKGSADATIYSLECSTSTFGLPVDCIDAWKHGYLYDTDVTIMPAGATNPFLVYCIMNGGINKDMQITIVPTNVQNRTFTKKIDVDYLTTTFINAKKLVATSAYCLQAIKLTCQGIELSKSFVWVDGASVSRQGFGTESLANFCPCSLQKSCARIAGESQSEMSSRKCNCDISDPETRIETNIITNIAFLPIQSLLFSTLNVSSQNNIVVGPLMCSSKKFDYDECTTGFHECDKHANCTNTDGGYTCQCRVGWQGLGGNEIYSNGRTCIDDNECNLNYCPTESDCTNKPGSFNCDCHDGFKKTAPTVCEDINECALNQSICDTNAKCLNTIGSYICVCNIGYRGSGNPGDCESIGTCSCWGDPHCLSFDGNWVHYQGLCTYTLARDNCDKGLPKKNSLPSFEVIITNWNQNVLPASVSYVKSVTIKIKNQRIEMKSGRIVTVDGQKTSLPYIPKESNGTKTGIEVSYYGNSVRLTAPNGIEIKFDGDSRVDVIVGSKMKSKMCGICGNFNYNPKDDWTIGPMCNVSGRQTDLLNLFGDSWRTEDVANGTESCPQKTCRQNPNETPCSVEIMTKATKECNKLADIFSDCEKAMLTIGRSLDEYIDSCIYDYCHSTGDLSVMICKTAESLAERCLEQYKVSVSYRKENFCNMKCEANMVYTTCAHACQPTCISNSSLSYCSTVCKEGCICATGYVMESGKCIKENQCGCVMADGTYYQDGEQRTNENCTETCTCTRATGQLKCAKTSCSSNAFCGFKNDDFSCHCKKGYMGDGVNCKDIDECSLVPAVCDKNAMCNNTDGSCACTCKEGFEGSGFNCSNINECYPKSPCEEIEECFDKVPGYECRCKNGFMKNSKTGKCEDKNECADTGNLCDRVSTNCTNTFGSYRCDCKYGFLANPTNSFVCTDVDECHIVHDCDKNFAKCTNTPGSYYCTCDYGYEGDGHNCTDINECVKSRVCQRPDSTCVNLPGSYQCRCLDGNPGCDGPNPCDHTKCSNPHEECYLGQCVCSRGYDRNMTTNLCEDVDECKTKKNDCSSRRAYCVNLEGSYKCDCIYGYQMSEVNNSCENINECMENLHLCGQHAECMDTNGGYFCQCKMGFTGHCDECRDIDECAINENKCDGALANCYNSIGSYRCECKDGFVGDGSECSDIDECSVGVNNCTDPRSFCLNTVGDYQCACLSGYTYDKSGKCIDINECLFADNGCNENAKCTNLEGSFLCQCNNGFVGTGDKCSPEDGKILCDNVLCPFNSDCVNKTCTCKLGFSNINKECIDTDECSSGTACDLNADCINTHGSYICHCRDGFVGDGRSCLNNNIGVDVCQLAGYCEDGNCYDGLCHCPTGFVLKNNRCYDQRCHNACPSGAICSTNSGSAVCTCPLGTSMSPDGSQCLDIDECSENYDDCQQNSLCRNLYSSYECVCTPGYLDVFGDGKVCKNVKPSSCTSTCPTGQFCKDDSCHCLDGLTEKTVNGERICEKELPSCLENTCPPNSDCQERLFGFLCHCVKGYEAVGLKSCKDVDECNRNLHNCSPFETCNNIPGSFECLCKPGYSKDSTSDTCKVTNTCTCGSNGVCHKDGSCLCKPGFKLSSGGICEDIDECTTEPPCHILAKCVNTPGSYECSCPENFYGDPITRCIEDKCATKQLICGYREECIRGLYSSVCVKTLCQYDEIMTDMGCIPATRACQSKICKINAVCKLENGRTDCFCDSGYTGDGDSCVDIDECSTDAVFCPEHSRCMNIPGGYYCGCQPGYQKNDYDGSCSEINECAVRNACATNAICTNLIGSFSCKCNEGFIGDAKYNCRMDSKCERYGGCHSNAACNLDSKTSTYVCQCNSGFSGDGVVNCIQDNLCSKDGKVQCHPNGECLQLNGTYLCICKPGFQGDGYRFCSDIDECAQTKTSLCSPLEKCVNLAGGYNCTCGTGATLVNDICQDIDECTGKGTSSCSEHAVCNNSVGSYTCACNDGYYGDGVTCTDVDECRLGIANCDTKALCVNKPGSFDCECQAGTIGNGTTCGDEDECKKPKKEAGAAQCDDNAICTNKNPGYECQCKDGYIGTGWNCVKQNPCNKPDVCNVNQTCSPSDQNETPVCTCKDDFELKKDKCVPIKACETGADTCDRNSENCQQLEIGFTCECKPGFKKVDGTCKDKNECDPTSPDYAAQKCAASGGGCLNSNGSFVCTCSKEQKKSGDGCKPIDPCAMKLDNCDKNVENCVSNGGTTYTCQCIQGYGKVNGTCTDIDECKEGVSDCKNGAICVNTVGSFLCSCPASLKLDDSKKSCKDRNECVENPLICKDFAKCVNTEGSFSCVCVQGYKWNGTNCEDIDECKDKTHPCHKYAACSNIPGACTCKCRPGYNGDGIYKCEETDECPPDVHVSCPTGTYCTYKNGVANCECKTGYIFTENISCNDSVCIKRCSDVDECITKKSACHPLAKCTNNGGAYVCKCPSYLVGDGKSECKDKDECALGEHMCDLDVSYCINNDNAVNLLSPFQCNCIKGYLKVPDTELCVNKNECLNPTENDCGPNSECIDTEGSYECRCLKGFKLVSSGKCMDVDECDLLTYKCGLHSSCNNTEGGYVCDCDPGYRLSTKNPGECEDINECLNSFSCYLFKYVTCVNTPGSFICPCAEGFVKEGGVCVDVDECVNPTICKDGSYCENDNGEYSCYCKPGFRRKEDGSCESINECMEGLDKCVALNGPDSTCYDLPMGYGCVCPPGFVAPASSPSKCVDLDECSTNSSNCLAGISTCKNTIGSFKCECQKGFTAAANKGCVDIDECAIGSKDNENICEHGVCSNTIGGYNCECDAGFQLVQGHCIDIDECTIERVSVMADNCDRDNGRCTNTPGSYICACRRGYTISNESTKCQDVDECSYPNSCLNGVCNNKLGSFECVCLPGYQISNGKCIDINECNKNPRLCGVSSSGVCINTDGSYKCLCSQGFENSGGKITSECLPVNECAKLNITCPPNAQCVDLDLGYRCICKDGYKEDQIGVCRNINECLLENSCHYMADCTDIDGSFLCTCKPGYTGDGKSTCSSICGPNTCPPNQMCKVTADNQFECGCSCQGDQCSDSGHVCDIYGVTFASAKTMLETACKQNKTGEVEYYHDCQKTCAKVTCPNTEICTMVDKRPTCTCPDCTDDEMKPHVLCSNNGIKFESVCQMKTWICQTKSLITKSYDGTCRRAIDCEMSVWSQWSGCTKTCGVGRSTRTRSVLAPAKFNGKCTDATTETLDCYNGPCPGDACEKRNCNPSSLCDKGRCICPDCSGLTTTDPVCGKIGNSGAGTYRTYCTLQHNACVMDSSFTYIHKGRCGDHIPSEPEICSVVTDFQIVNSTDNCSSVDPVRTNLCSGGCGLDADYCCRPLNSRVLRVKFKCQDNSFVFKEVKTIASCECTLERGTTEGP